MDNTRTENLLEGCLYCCQRMINRVTKQELEGSIGENFFDDEGNCFAGRLHQCELAQVEEISTRHIWFGQGQYDLLIKAGEKGSCSGFKKSTDDCAKPISYRWRTRSQKVSVYVMQFPTTIVYREENAVSVVFEKRQERECYVKKLIIGIAISTHHVTF